MNDPANDAGNALIVNSENRIQSFRFGDFHLARFGHASCVHIPRTLETRLLWQGSDERDLGTIRIPVKASLCQAFLTFPGSPRSSVRRASGLVLVAFSPIIGFD